MKKTSIDKLIIFLISIFILFGLYFLIAPRKLNIQYYYNIINKNSISSETFDFNADKFKVDLNDLKHCQTLPDLTSREYCFLGFYKAYTIKNGAEKALSHLSQMMLTDKSLTNSCHYITHGIGEGYYIRNKKDLNKSFQFDVYKYFKNIMSCGNGFYHGISIGLTRGAKDDEDLFNMLNGFCEAHPERSGGNGEESCTHGLGHAINIYYDHDREKTLAMCDRLLKDKKGYFGCLTGAMMEYSMYTQQLGIVEPEPSGQEKICGEYERGTLNREACIIETSGFLRYGSDYIGVSKVCQNLQDSTERKACMKLNFIHAIRLDRDVSAADMCSYSKTFSERVECTSFLAKYLSMAVDLRKDAGLYKEVLKNVCHTLPLYGYYKCLALNMPGFNTFESHVEYGILPTFTDIKTLYEKGFLSFSN